MSRRKHRNLFQINFMWHRSLHKEMKIWSSKLDLNFHIRFDEEWSHGNVRQGVKGQELSAVNWEAAGFFFQFPLSVSLSSKVRRSFPLDRGIWHLSAEELSSCFRGRSGSPKSSLHLPFPQISFIWICHYTKIPCHGGTMSWSCVKILIPYLHTADKNKPIFL